MELLDAVRCWHSVRQYLDKPLEENTAALLQAGIERCNRESGLHIQLVREEPSAFDSFMARYGKFSGVRNYIALAGKKGAELQEQCGYYGERLVLDAQRLGLNSCWVAMTYKKIPSAVQLDPGETLCLVVAIGYGRTQGVPHPVKSREAVTEGLGPSVPDWFYRGVDAALLAPTAMNQQKFKFTLSGDRVSVRTGAGFYTRIDLGIVKYHFEIAAGKENFSWS